MRIGDDRGRELCCWYYNRYPFPANEMQILCERIPGARYFEIDSLFGHDGFLVEYEQFNNLLRPIMR